MKTKLWLFLVLASAAIAQTETDPEPEEPSGPISVEYAYPIEKQIQAFVFGTAAMLPLMVPMLLIHYSRKAAAVNSGGGS